jgi:hypothetical protein
MNTVNSNYRYGDDRISDWSIGRDDYNQRILVSKDGRIIVDVRDPDV